MRSNNMSFGARCVTLVATWLILISCAFCQEQAFYAISTDGGLYEIDRRNPANVAQLVRTISKPAATGVFSGLIYKDGSFYTTFGPSQYVIKFGFDQGDEIVIGQLSLYGWEGRIALRGDGTAWIVHTDSSLQTVLIRTVNLDTLSLGATSSPAPAFITLTGSQDMIDAVFDSSGKLIVHWALGSTSYITRINSLSTYTWDYDCNALSTAQLPCWYDGNTVTGSVTASDTGTTYILYGLSLRSLSLPNTAPASQTNYFSYTTQVAALSFPVSGVTPNGLTLAPPTENYYVIKPNTVVSF